MVILLWLSRFLLFLHWRIISKDSNTNFTNKYFCVNNTNLFLTNSSSINLTNNINKLLFHLTNLVLKKYTYNQNIPVAESGQQDLSQGKLANHYGESMIIQILAANVSTFLNQMMKKINYRLQTTPKLQCPIRLY